MAYIDSIETPGAVILSGAKDLHYLPVHKQMRILRFAQDDR